MHPWLDTLHRALQDDERTARQAHHALTELSIEEQVEAGICWAGIRLTDLQPDGRKWSAVVRGDLHEGIGAGDRIRLGRDGPTGRVIGVDPHGAEIQVEAEPDPSTSLAFKLYDDSTPRRYRQALERADQQSSPVVLALLGEEPIAAPWDEPDRPRPAWPRLNASQRSAALATLDQPLSLIHGPPGTGKTTVVTALLVAAVADGDRPWALADSNTAADHLATSARDAGLEVLRMGVSARIRPSLAECTLEAWIARSPFAATLAALDKEMARARSRRESGRVLGPLYDERRQLRAQARQWAWESAEVLVCTHGSMAGRLAFEPRPPSPTLAVVDEATQAIEPAIWVSAPFVQRMVLVGDPEQLGPVVKTPNSPLQVSALERLLREHEAPMLSVQHRMHARLHALVQSTYGPSYEAHPRNAAHTLFDLPHVREEVPVLEFVDTAGSEATEHTDPTSRSRFNRVEVALVQRALTRLLDAGLSPSEIAIATPYNAQARLLRALPEAAGVRVGSINALQGQEAEAVLLSFVRSNERGELGFLNDKRRLTVALTRARRHLWMCGDSATLGRHPLYATLLEHCDQTQSLTSVWDPAWSLD